MRKTIETLIKKIVKELYGIEKEIIIDISKNSAFDYSVNIALQASKEIGKSPMEIAGEIVETIQSPPDKGDLGGLFETIQIVAPGFIYFKVSKNQLAKLLETDFETWGNGEAFDKKNIMVEYAHPNTHKAFHIGHLRNISLGEAIIRLLEGQGAKVFRANYQGDVGPHVAKCMWAVLQDDQKETVKTHSAGQKAEYLGKSMQKGGNLTKKTKQ